MEMIQYNISTELWNDWRYEGLIDWYSRYVLTWQLSNTLDGWFCLEVIDSALAQGRPEILNTDQGAQFSANAFTTRLLKSRF